MTLLLDVLLNRFIIGAQQVGVYPENIQPGLIRIRPIDRRIVCPDVVLSAPAADVWISREDRSARRLVARSLRSGCGNTEMEGSKEEELSKIRVLTVMYPSGR